MLSLNTRILAGASVVLACFIGLTGLTLDRAFRDSARSARQERMMGELYLLMAAADVSAQGRLTMPPVLAQPELNLPGSGQYATITDASGKMLWQSPSRIDNEPPYQPRLPSGAKQFDQSPGRDGQGFFVQSYGVNWATGNGKVPLTFSVTEDLSGFNAQIARYRRSLWGGLGVMSLILLVAQAALLRWGLRPLRSVASDLAEIEAGHKEALEGEYPYEIELLTDNINLLLTHERAQQKRYRNSLSDLAHSLKTPLAVMRATLSGSNTRDELAATVEDEVARMDQIVSYQLQRGAPMAPIKLSAAVQIAPLVARVTQSLGKLYRDKGIAMEVRIPGDVRLRIDERELMELFGNLIENACKYGGARVRVGTRRDNSRVTIVVEDDGKGIEDGVAQLILERGVRADSTAPGHGLGLDIVRNIVEAYGGTIQVGKSELGGAAFTLSLPAR